MELEWTPEALHDLDDAGQFIAVDNPAAAAKMAQRVLEAVEYLEKHPALGHTGRYRGTRELVVSGSPFVVVYQIRLNVIQIVRVLHHARIWH